MYEILNNNKPDKENIKNNRKLLKQLILIDVICLTARQELPFRREVIDEGKLSFNKDKFVETVHILMRWDLVLMKHLNTSITFNDINIKVQNYLISTVNENAVDAVIK